MAVNGEEQGVHVDLNSGLKFPCPKNFDGSEEKFEHWAYKFRSYMSISNPLIYFYLSIHREAF